MVLNIFTSQYLDPVGVSVQTDYDCFTLYPSISTYLLPSSFRHFRLQLKINIRVMPWTDVRFTIAGCNFWGKKICVAQRTTLGGWVACVFTGCKPIKKNVLGETLIWSEQFSGAHICRLRKNPKSSTATSVWPYTLWVAFADQATAFQKHCRTVYEYWPPWNVRIGSAHYCFANTLRFQVMGGGKYEHDFQLLDWIWIGLDLFNDDIRPSGHISRPTQVNVSQSCFHSLNDYSTLIIL